MNSSQYKNLSQIQTDPKHLIYLAQQEIDGKDIILKLPKSAFPSELTLKKLKEEFAILKRVNHPNIINAIRIETYENSLAIILEAIQGITLSKFLKNKPISIDAFFPIAISLVETIKFLHGKRIIHKNINPNSIFIENTTKQPKLTGFSLASELSRQAQQANTMEAFDADLSYISPEQTGRINRVIDHQTDLYSLGVVFYEMLTGVPPFISKDPMELIHSHIARQIKPPSDLNSEIPPVISQIITRLLAKSAEDRYQSAAGLLYDLKQCETLYNNQNSIENFEIATLDIHEQFRIPDKLYGRENEVEKMLQTFNNASNGRSEVMLVMGYSGVGKTRLVSEVKKIIGQNNGYFISGKFDQFKRDIPLSSLLSAFKDLIRQILTESDSHIAEWKTKVLETIGLNGKIITTVLPEMEKLIGVQPEVEALPPMESSNRFNQVFTSFIKIFAQPENPLCIFLDDLQWFDSATRQWIETQLIGEDFKNLLLIGAYRDNEVTPSHPLMQMLDRMRQIEVPIFEIHLQPLDKATLNHLVADVLATEPQNCSDLSELIYQKTNGNPFFTKECLLALYESNAIFFDAENHVWKYDLIKVREAASYENVVDLMLEQIHRLPIAVQKTLKIAACIGSQFNLNLLNKVSEQGFDKVFEMISVAVQKGLVLPIYSYEDTEIEEYKFLHDRVQQAAFSLIEESEKEQIRLKIGRLLLAGSEISASENNIYDIADNLNFAKNLISDADEIQKIVEVNLQASIRAKNAIAYEPALKYISQAMAISPSSLLEKTSKLTSELYQQRAESEHLCGNNEVAEAFFDKAVAHAENVLDKAKIYQQKIHYYCNLQQFDKAYQTGREAVRPLGVSLPAKFIPPLLIKELLTYQFLKGRTKVSDIINKKEMTNENLKMAVHLMATIGRAAYQIRPELCVNVCAKIVNTCLKNGNTDGVFVGYLAIGPIFFGAILGNKQTGFDIGQLTLALLDKYKSKFYKAEAYFVVGYFAMPWRRPAIEMEKYWQISYETGLETGDLFHTSCSCCGTIQSHLMRGVGFNEILNLSEQYIDFMKKIKNNEAILTIQSIKQTILNLRGETDSKTSFNTPDFNEIENLKQYEAFSSRHFAHYYFINKMQSLYLWGEYQEAYKISLISDKYLKDSPGMLHTAEHYFYKGLIIAALYENSKGIQRLKWQKDLHKIRANFRKYTKGCPDNFIHKSQLLEAEICRVEGEINNAENLYYLALDSAIKYAYTNIQALTNALLAKFHYKLGRNRLASFHLNDANYSYKTLGATAIAADLLARFPDLIEREDFSQKTFSEKTKNAQNFDLVSVLKSSEAISREIRLRDLLSSLIKIIIENAGAERMVLMLQRGENLVVEAEYFAGNDEVKILSELPFSDYQDLSKPVVNFVHRSQETVILEEATQKGNFTNDSYFQTQKTRSVLCTPLVQQGKLTAIIYLENNLTNAAFTQERIDLLLLMSGQMAISIENALLYENLEEKVKERTRELNEEKDRTESLLLNILPAETAQELKLTGTAKAKDFEQVTVLFTDFKNFSAASEQMNAQELVSEINYYYTAFDNIIAKFGIEKIKTIGDSYMCAGGLPVEKKSNPYDTVMAALEIRDFMIEEKNKRKTTGKTFIEMRIGLHTGHVVAGIVGIRKFAYDIWGDTVNIASRMESSGEPNKVNISGSTYELVKDKFNCTHRGKIEAKNKGLIDMYFVDEVK